MENFRTLLGEVRDLERTIGRLSIGQATHGICRSCARA